MKTEKELNEIFANLEKLNLRETNGSGGKDIYKFPPEIIGRKAQTSFRKKLRNKVLDVCVIIYNQNKSFLKTKKIADTTIPHLEKFLKIYKENFLVNNFEFSSIREKCKDPNEQQIIEATLHIAQSYVSAKK